MTVTTVLSPLPGIFYRKPAPDQPPYKNQGDAVTAGDTLCLIEVMKTFTPVVAEHRRNPAALPCRRRRRGHGRSAALRDRDLTDFRRSACRSKNS